MNTQCPNCGREIKLAKPSVFCPYCWHSLGTNHVPIPEDFKTVTVIAMDLPGNHQCQREGVFEEDIGKTTLADGHDEKQIICPVCCCEITQSDIITVCPDCHLAYHKDCWEENHGCATYGCPSTGCLNPPPLKVDGTATSRPPNDTPEADSTAHTDESSGFECPFCHTKLASGIKICWNCGQELPRQEEPPKSSEEPQNSSPQDLNPFTSNYFPPAQCSFGRKVLAVALCGGYVIVLFSIYFAMNQNSSANSNSEKTPYWLNVAGLLGCSGIWKFITSK